MDVRAAQSDRSWEKEGAKSKGPMKFGVPSGVSRGWQMV